MVRLRTQGGYFTVVSMVMAGLIVFLWAVLLTGYAAFQAEVLIKERLRAALYRGAYVASEQGAWGPNGFSIDPGGAAAEFKVAFPVLAGLSAVWGPTKGGPAIDGPVILESLQVFQATDANRVASLYCPATGQTTAWEVGEPGVLAAIAAPVKVSILGVGIYDQTLCVAAFASPPWWDATTGDWR